MINKISLFIVLLFIIQLTSCNIYDLQYGKLYNKQRKKLGVIKIPDNWTLTKQTPGNLRYSTVDELDKLKIIINKENYKGHIEKFIHIWNKHYELDHFLISKNDKLIQYKMYTMHYSYDNKEKKCGCYDATHDNKIINSEFINCSVIDSLFLKEN